eukprot:400973_1
MLLIVFLTFPFVFPFHLPYHLKLFDSNVFLFFCRYNCDLFEFDIDFFLIAISSRPSDDNSESSDSNSESSNSSSSSDNIPFGVEYCSNTFCRISVALFSDIAFLHLFNA